MNIFLIIFGGVLFILGGLFWLTGYLATCSNENWELYCKSFRKSWEEKEHAENVSLPEIPEELLYDITIKIRNIGNAACLIGLIIAVAGIILQVTVR